MTDPLEVVNKIKSLGNWEVIIRPTKYAEDRIPDLQALLPALQKLAVRRTGMWAFPEIAQDAPPARGLHWIQGGHQNGSYLYFWRFTQSGQMFHISGMISDWLSEGLWPTHPNWKPLTTLGIGESLWRFTDIFEFASRFATTDSGTDRIEIRATVTKLRDRKLWVDDPRRAPVTGNYIAHVNDFPYQRAFDRIELIADARKLALNAALKLYALFDWDPSPQLIQNYQDELIRNQR